MKECPPTFDYATFIVCARTLGATHVHFRSNGEIQTKKFRKEIAWKRFENIILPLTKLAGLTYSIGPGGDGVTPAYHFGTVEALYKKLGYIWKFPMLDGDKGYVTATLRNSFRNQTRNSSKDWFPFIERLSESGKKVVVLPDAEENSISIVDRMRVYANAEMNYGVNNGPMALCCFSEAPYRIFKMLVSKDHREHHEKTGFPDGSQFSFRNDRQMLVWKPDTLENLLDGI